MARKPKEVIAIVLDIGRSVSEDMYDKSTSYFDTARACASMILKRKLVDTKNKDLVSLFLLGSEDTINSLDYPNIELQFPMSTVSWKMLKFLDKDVHPTNINGDWLDAVVVAMNYIKDEVDGMTTPISAKKVMVLSNFKAPVDGDQMNTIIKSLKHLDIELSAIGPNLGLESNKLIKCETESLLFNVIKEVGGLMCSFAEALPCLQYFPVRDKKPVAWNAVMTIGPDINIAVSSYKMIGKVTLPSMKEMAVQDVHSTARAMAAQDLGAADVSENFVGLVKETTFMKQDAAQTSIDSSDVIKGYRFGSTIVPFSKVDLESLKYKSGPKCLHILGFTKEKTVPVHHLVGDSTHHVKARRGDINAAKAMSALVHALHDQKMVAVARKVYRDNALVHMGVLFPKLSPCEALVFVELPFSDEIRQFVFQSLSNVKPTDEQSHCVDALIDSMDLMSADKDAFGNIIPAFQPSRTLDPYHQHFYHTVCDRAVHPDSPLPPPQQYILDSLLSPYRDNPTTVEALDKVQDKFPLLVMKSKRPRKTAAETFKQDDAEDVADVKTADLPVLPTTMAKVTSTSVVQIGTVDPVNDFDTLIRAGQPLAVVGKEMGEVALNLVLRSFGSDDFPKASAALQRLRKECVARDNPTLYNVYVAELKEKVLARGKKPFWEEMRRACLGLVTRDECRASGVDPEEASLFLMKQDEETEVEQNQDQGMDIEDLLNEM